SGARLMLLLSRELQEDFLEADPQRTQLQQAPAIGHDRARDVAADVVVALAFDFEAGECLPLIRHDDVADAREAAERRSHRLDGRGIHLDEEGLDAFQAARQVVRRVDRDDTALVDDADAVAGLRDFGQDVRAEYDGVVAAQALDQVARFDDLLRIETGGRPGPGQPLPGVANSLAPTRRP